MKQRHGRTGDKIRLDLEDTLQTLFGEQGVDKGVGVKFGSIKLRQRLVFLWPKTRACRLL